MSVLSRAALEASPLADLHALASELGIDGFRRLRKADLVSAILERQGGELPVDEAAVEPVATENGAGPAEAEVEVEAEAEVETEVEAEPEEAPRPRRRRSRARSADPGDAVEADAGSEEEGTTDEGAGDEEDRAVRPRRTRRPATRGRRRTARDRDEEILADDAEVEVPAPRTEDEPEDRVVEGTVELIGNGSGFLRLEGEDDVYVSAAQVRRCELVDGDRVGGPVRPPRRSERFPSLVRVDTINGRAADEVTEGTPYDELPATFPTERLPLDDGDATLKAIGWLTPLGRGSRATIVGPTQAGKSEALRRLARALAAQEGLEVSVVLAGVRPEELADWGDVGVEPVASITLASSGETRLSALERAVETAKRIAARGGDAVLLVDGLEGLPPHGARRALAAARNLVDGGSLTVVATAPAPVGGETTVVALDRALTATRRFPAVDLAASGTMRAELLVGEAGADAIAQARAAGIR